MEPTKTSAEAPLRYCLYARKSSESDEKQAMSIDSQIREMLVIAESQELNVVDMRQESKSAKATGQRVAFNQMIADISEGLFDAIIAWAPDRLSRNAGDLAQLVDLMDQGKLHEIKTHGQIFRNNPNEKFLLMILCSQAKLENDNRGKNVKRGNRACCKQGRRPGKPPIGYKLWRDPDNLNMRSIVKLDPERAPLIQKLFAYIYKDGLSGRIAYEKILEDGLTTRSGKIPPLSMIYRILKEPFYTGKFEYPRGSDDWYKGSYEPLINQRQFKKVQNALMTYQKSPWGSKTFYFNKLFKCKKCGSGVCGEHHTNRQGKSYTYYKCNKFGGRKKCDQKYIREENLINEVATIVSKHQELHVNVSKRIKRDLDKINRFQTEPISVDKYIRDVLKKGNSLEKRNILQALDGQLYLADGMVTFEGKSIKNEIQ